MNFISSTRGRSLLVVASLLLVSVVLYTTGAFTSSRRIEPVVSDYKVEFRAKGSVLFATDQPDGRLSIESGLSESRVRVTTSQAYVGLQWRPSLTFTINGQRLYDQEKLLNSVGEHRVVLSLSPDGAPEKVFYEALPTLPPEAAELVLNTAKMLVLQFAWRKADPEISEGFDYWGDHTRVRSGSGQMFSVETTSVQKTQSGIRGTGKFTIEFGNDGSLQALTGSHRTSPAQGLQLGDSETVYSIKRESDQAVSGDPAQALDLAGLVEDVPWVAINSKAMMKATLEERTKGWSLDRIVQEAASLMKTNKTSARDLLALTTKLQELLWLNPSLADELSRLAGQLGPSHVLFDEILKALTWVGNEECQTALQKLLSQYQSDESAAIRVMVGLAFVETPNEQSQQALEAVASSPPSPSIGRTSELLLGQLAFQLIDSDLSRAEEIQSRYVDQLQSPQDTRQINHALNVIGNTGICRNFEAIEKFVGHSDPGVHGRALEALRFCEDSRVAPLLVEAFHQTEEQKELIIKILEMRAQRGIYDPSIFSFIYDWIREAGASHSLGKPAVGVLSQLARLDRTAASRYSELKSDCENLKLCAFF